MGTRYRQTRKRHPLVQKGGGKVLQYNSFRIFDINKSIEKQNVHGFEYYESLTILDSNTRERFNLDNMIKNGTLFNNSVCYHEYKGKGYLLGTARFNNDNKDDIRTRTTIHNRDPLSDNSNWVRGWYGIDVPMFFLVQLETMKTRFFAMNYVVNEATNKQAYDFSLEDPRIMIHPDDKTVLFFAHHPTKILDDATQTGLYDKFGTNLSSELNKASKTPKDKLHSKRPQYPYVSWCELSSIEFLIEKNFIDKTAKALPFVPNQPWRPLCTNLLNPEQEKNWVIIPNTVDKAPVFDFIRSMGSYTESVVVFRYPTQSLRANTLVNGVYNDNSSKCIYIQSLEGKVKIPGQAIKKEGYFDLPNNNKITKLANKTKAWFQYLIKLFVNSIPSNQILKYKEFKYSIQKVGDEVSVRYPFLLGRTSTGTPIWETNKYSLANNINALKVDIFKGISSGGPAIPILNSSDPKISVSVGHFKPVHQSIYTAMVAALLFKTDPAFRKYIQDNIVPGGIVPLSDPEDRKVFLEFISYLTDTDNIFRYIYSYIYTLEPYHATSNPTFADAVGKEKYFSDKPVLHKNQVYCSFLFKLRSDNFELLSLSPQIFFDNSPTDCKGPSLQFCSTIASNGKDTYYIPYGDNDVVGRIAFISKNDLHNFLTLEKSIQGPESGNESRYYFEVAKQFFLLYMFKQP